MIGRRLRLGRRTLPLGRDDVLRFLPWLFALMAYVAGLAGIGLLAIDDTLRASEGPVAARLTVQIPAEASNARLQTVLAMLNQTAGVRSVHLLTPAETARLLEPWLGTPVPIEELPVPRLIDLGIDPDEAIDLAKLREQLASVAPEARLDDQRGSLGGLRAATRPLRLTLAAVIGAALLLTAVLAVFATRAALVIRGSVIELLNMLGAPDRDVAHPFAIRALWAALLGGGIAAVAVLLTLAAFDGVAAIVSPVAPVAGIGAADWRLWAILFGTAITAGLVAMASALVTVRCRLARTT